MSKQNPLLLNLTQVAEEYSAGATMEDIAKKYNCGIPTVSVTFKAYGIKARPRSYRKTPKTWSITPEEAKKAYLDDKLSIADIAEKYKIYSGRVSAYLNEQEVTLRSNSEVKRIYSVNENYFENIDIGEKAYWLGFFMADGYNYEVDGGVCLTLAYVDKPQLEAFKAALQSEHPIVDGKENVRFGITGKPLRAASLAIYSKKLSKDLVKWGCPQAKSFITYFPNIDAQFQSHFIRGLMDGDGSVHLTEKSSGWCLAGTESLMRSCQEILMKNCMLDKIKLRAVGKIFVLRYGGLRQLRRIYDYLYKDATVWLERKKSKFYAIVKDVPSLDDIVI